MERYGIVSYGHFENSNVKIVPLLVSDMNNQIESYVEIMNYWEFHFYLSVCEKPINVSCLR